MGNSWICLSNSHTTLNLPIRATIEQNNFLPLLTTIKAELVANALLLGDSYELGPHRLSLGPSERAITCLAWRACLRERRESQQAWATRGGLAAHVRRETRGRLSEASFICLLKAAEVARQIPLQSPAPELASGLHFCKSQPRI